VRREISARRKKKGHQHRMSKAWIGLWLLALPSGVKGQDGRADDHSEKQNFHKSRGTALAYSFLLPGLGDLYLRDWKMSEWGSGKIGFATEVALWASHLYLSSYSGWVKDDARALAATHAGVDWSEAKPQGYFSNIGKFSSIYSYNDVQRRFTGPEGNLYNETLANYWSWDAESQRQKYDDRRIRSRSFKRYSEFVLYGIFVNHVISMIRTARTYRRMERSDDMQIGFSYRPLMPSGQQDVWMFSFTRQW